MSPEATPTKIFLCWAHCDEQLKEDFVDLLKPQLRLRPAYQFEWWEDTHLVCGEKWEETILNRIGEADYGLQLISPTFLTSKFIIENEIPPFLGEDPRCLPVSLINVPLDDEDIDWHGIKAGQIFSLDGKSFQQVTDDRRQEFVTQVAFQITKRIKKAQGQSRWQPV